MYIDSVRLKHFRNYENQTIPLKNGMNILLGPNGIGKTNLLESIYLLSTTRSHRNDDDKEMICFGQDFASVEGIVKRENASDKLEVILRKTGKSLSVNSVPIKKNSEFIGKLNAVIFSPNDMTLFDALPKERRRLVDLEMGKLSTSYMHDLSIYLKALKQRNAYLKNYKNKQLLETYTDVIVAPQVKIIKARNQFVDFLNGYLSYFFNEISGSKSKLQIVYKSFIQERNDEEEMAKQIKAVYEHSREKDVSTAQTNTGIHREDYEFYLDGMNVGKYCSQGQKRMVILAIKLSIVQIIYQIKREYPILLLDDVFSELDEQHRICLLKFLPNSVQSIITTTDLREIYNIKRGDANILNFGR